MLGCVRFRALWHRQLELELWRPLNDPTGLLEDSREVCLRHTAEGTKLFGGHSTKILESVSRLPAGLGVVVYPELPDLRRNRPQQWRVG